MNRRSALRGAVLALAAMAWSARDATAFCRTTTVRPPRGVLCSDAGIPVMWCSACVGMSLDPEGSPDVSLDELRVVAQAAMARWRDVSCPGPDMEPPAFELQLIEDSSDRTLFDEQGPNANTIWFNRVWAPDEDHRPGVIAITRSLRNTSTGAMLSADIEFNQQSDENPNGFRFTTGAADPNFADLPTVMTHELGHALGLGHSDVERAVMWENAGLGEQRRSLTADDVEGVCDIYAIDRRPSRQCDPLGASTRPALLCNPTPYGGFSPGPSAARARGGCSITPRAVDRGLFCEAALALAAGVCAARRSRSRRR